MFRVNRRTDYAVRVMLCLAKRPVGARVSTQSVQDEMLVPRPFLQRIVADLAKAELVQTFPGPNGGLELARPAATIHLRHIWEAIEGPLLLSDCLAAEQECPLDVTCPVHSRWGRLQVIMARELESSNLEQLSQEARQMEHLRRSRTPGAHPSIPNLPVDV